MDRLYKIKCEVPFQIFWDSFVPSKLTDWLDIQDKDNIRVRIGLTEETVRSAFLEKVPDISHSIFATKTISIELEGNWSEEIADLLRVGDNESDLLKDFRAVIQKKLLQIYSALVNSVRNHFEQWRIHEISYNEEGIFFNNTLWLDDDAKWKRVFPKTILIKVELYPYGISEDNWREIGKRLQEKIPIKMTEILIANAKTHLTNGNSRLAIVESVCALESIIKQLIPRLLSGIVNPPIPENLLGSAIEKTGLLLTAEIFFNHIYGKFNLSKTDCEKCIEAIDKRNAIIHGNQRYVPLKEAKEFVDAIDRIIYSLNQIRNQPEIRVGSAPLKTIGQIKKEQKNK